MARACRVDYPEKQMEHEEEPRINREENRARTGAASTGADQTVDVASEPVPSQNVAGAPVDAQSVRASIPTKANEPPPLNKWQTFWRGVLHVDTAKMEPWIAL